MVCAVCLLAVGVLAVSREVSRDGVNRRLIHAENLAKAEQFKREFDAHVAEGTALPAVEEYLRTKPVKVERSMGFRDGQDFVRELMIEVAGERSVNWYCGMASVGLIAQFDSEKLGSNHVESWSFNCP